MLKMTRGFPVKKISKDEYVDTRTGEVLEYDHIENRQESSDSLSKTFKRLRYLINNNFVGADNELFITLTYAENMTSTDRLYCDIKRFMTRVRRKYDYMGKMDYINIVEPQERGAWHCHILMKWDTKAKIFIPNAEIRKLWGQGFVVVKSLESVDNIGAYLTAYLTDIPLDQWQGDSKLDLKFGSDGKKYVKGGRLHMYPPGMQLYRKSKGIIMPESEKMLYEDIKKRVGSRKPTLSLSYEITQDDLLINQITYQQYNLKR